MCMDSIASSPWTEGCHGSRGPVLQLWWVQHSSMWTSFLHLLQVLFRSGSQQEQKKKRAAFASCRHSWWSRSPSDPGMRDFLESNWVIFSTVTRASGSRRETWHRKGWDRLFSSDWIFKIRARGMFINIKIFIKYYKSRKIFLRLIRETQLNIKIRWPELWILNLAAFASIAFL